MSGGLRNSSQDPDYVGPVGFEKKFHQTHFQGVDVPWKRTPIDQDSNYVRVGPGKYKRREGNGLDSLGIPYHKLDRWTFWKKPLLGERKSWVAECDEVRFEKDSIKSLFKFVRRYLQKEGQCG